MSRVGDYVNEEPFREAVAVTKHDTNTFDYSDAIYIGGDGDLKVRMSNGLDATFAGMKAGTGLNIRVDRVYSTGTTATNILRLNR